MKACFLRLRFLWCVLLAAMLTACGSYPSSPSSQSSPPLRAATNPQSCAALAGVSIPADRIGASAGLKSGAAVVDSATWTAATPLRLGTGPMPEAMVNPATPEHCKVLGHIRPVDPAAPNIHFQVNLPKEWTGAAVQLGGGGFNGVLINGYSLVRGAPFDKPAPLALGFVTVGTDSGHQNKPGVPLQAFAANEEAFVNFAHAAYKKVKDVAVALMQITYGSAPRYMVFSGSSEGGREGLTMAQRYPRDFQGVISRVPVINWTGLMHIGMSNGLAAMNEGWMNDEQTRLVHDAVLAACDLLDGAKDGIVSDPVGCRSKFDAASLLCKAGQGANCLNPAQIQAIKTLHAPMHYPFALAHAVTQYPGRGPSAEALPTLGVNGPMGGWKAWWLGSAPPAMPTRPDTRSWDYSMGAIQHIFMQKPNASAQELFSYKMENHRARVQQVSALMDSTNPDLSAFHEAGGKLILMEYMGDYAQSPYAGIAYFESVQRQLGAQRVAQFAKLYVVPGVDHVGSGAPATADLFNALTAWIERGVAPAGLTLYEHSRELPLAAVRSRPLCEWPLVTRYKGGDINTASSFACEK